MISGYDDLNDVQLEAVKATDGPVLILAGAGSGKTRSLTYRIAYLINEKKIKSSEILAVTFTNKAAREMKERVEKLLGSNITSLWIGTFHSICARILRAESDQLGFSNSFTIYDSDDQVRALKKIISILNVPQQLYSAKMIQSRLSRVKNQFLFPDDLDSESGDGLDEYLPQIYREYQKFLKENNAMDFDDLLIKPIELFDKKPEIRKKYSNKFKYVLVDEYQDTNRAQYLFIKKLVTGHRNLCVVGDEDQSIYGWRGADISNILNFNKDFNDARIYKLEENYRSNENILLAANAVVGHNTERIGKNLWTRRKKGDKITVYAAQNDMDEAKRIVDVVHEEMYTKKRSFSDIAVLYRTNAQSRVIEDELRRNAISYIIIGGVKFYDRKEIKDIIAYLKLIVNPADSISLKRIVNFPLRGIGDTTISKIEKFAEIENISLFNALGRVKEISSISPAMGGRVIEFYNLISNYISLKEELSTIELASTLASETGILHHYQTEYDQYESESKVANIKELFQSIEQFTEERIKNKMESNLASFLEDVSLMTDIDSWNNSNNAVTLMTLHAAKGLEFPVVFITGMEMGLLPLQRNSADISELEEERRLLYVGMTRAEENLYLSFARSRRKYASFVQCTPSLFLDEIPVELLSYTPASREALPQRSNRGKARRKKIQSYFETADENQTVDDTYKVGQEVYHSTFGKGKILNLEGAGDKMKITVHFQDEGITKKLIRQYANLSPIEG
ncbi:MAG: ATP-dependent helicase [Calditrichaceae bacterium]